MAWPKHGMSVGMSLGMTSRPRLAEDQHPHATQCYLLLQLATHADHVHASTQAPLASPCAILKPTSGGRLALIAAASDWPSGSVSKLDGSTSICWIGRMKQSLDSTADKETKPNRPGAPTAANCCEHEQLADNTAAAKHSAAPAHLHGDHGCQRMHALVGAAAAAPVHLRQGRGSVCNARAQS